VLHNLQQAGERTRTLSIVKSRGSSHSNQARELLLSDRGIELVEVFVGPDGQILTGSARGAQEMADRTTAAKLQQEVARKRAIMAQKRKAMEARIADMQAELAAETAGFDLVIAEQESIASSLSASRKALARNREDESRAPIHVAEGARK
jgi:circadian clock protein KaiC